MRCGHRRAGSPTLIRTRSPRKFAPWLAGPCNARRPGETMHRETNEAEHARSLARPARTVPEVQGSGVGADADPRAGLRLLVDRRRPGRPVAERCDPRRWQL